MSNRIHFILTGGTIEKSYDPSAEKPEFLYESLLPEYLEARIKSHMDVSFETLCQIDSAQMSDEIRADIAAAILRAPSNHIVIMHGTSTMAHTLDYLAEHLGDTDKTVILSGAMIPLREFAMSDAGFNMGFAMASAQHAPAGVYLAMNATLFKPGTVTKDIVAGRFERLQ